MFKSILKRILSVFLCLAVLFTLCSCSGEYDDSAALYVDLDSSPTILDPQLASTDSELIVVRNLFEGLMRYNSDGVLECGAAESYTKNGLTYTFTLRNDLAWSNGDVLTADDFVFALRRAVDKATNAPFASKLFCIANAQQIFNGQADKSTLGVTAKDDKTLVFTLLYDDASFLQTLSQAISMPCNQAVFYDAHGQYGLSDDCLVSNGSYRLRSWDTESKTVKLARNAEYTGIYPAKNYSVIITNSQDDNLLLLEEARADTVLLKYNEFERARHLYNINSLQNTVWFLIINKNSTALSSTAVREAFIKSVDLSSLSGIFYTNSLTAADNILPEILIADKAVDDPQIAYDTEYARRLYLNATLNQKITDFKLLYLQGMDATASNMAANWQQLLGAVVNTEAVSGISALNSRIATAQYDMALVPVSADSTDIYSYLLNFTSGSICSINNQSFDNLVSSLNGKQNDSIDTTVKAQLEKLLLSDYILYPIASSLCGIASTDTIVSQNYSLTEGYMDFAFFEKS